MHKPVREVDLPTISGVGDSEEVVPPVLSLFTSVKVIQQFSQRLLGDINRQTRWPLYDSSFYSRDLLQRDKWLNSYPRSFIQWVAINFIQKNVTIVFP